MHGPFYGDHHSMAIAIAASSEPCYVCCMPRKTDARANAIALQRAERVDLRREPPPAADALAANLARPLLLALADRIREPPRELLVSGLLEEEADELVSAFRGLREARRLREGGWASILLRRP